MNEPKTIVVDMTPMLPGAVNGGAKILVLELLARLPKLVPDWHFILLTRRSSHDELAVFDSANVTRKLVWMDVPAAATRASLSDRFVRLDTRMIRKLSGRLRRARYELRRLAAANSRRIVNRVLPSLLFSPFGLSESFQDGDYLGLDVPSVAILYDLQHRHYPEFFDGAEVAKRERNFQHHRASSVMACISDFVRDSAIEAGVAADSVVTIYIRLRHRLAGFDPHQATQILKDLGLRPEGYLVYPANFWPHKNHATLLEALSIARREGLSPDIKLVCTGAPGAQAIGVAEMAGAAGLKDAVVFPGFLRDTQFSALLGSARGVVFPSLYEGFGMPVVEAMAARRPVACSNSTSVREVAGAAALLFDPRSPQEIARAIGRLVADEPLRSALVEKGAARADAFADTDLMAREYLKLFATAFKRWDSRPRIAGRQHVRGIYNDGWAMPEFVVQYGHGSAGRTLRIALQAPGMVPTRRYDLSIHDMTGARIARHWVAPGAASTIEVPLGPQPGICAAKISPFFRPTELRELGGTTDTRKLTVMIQKIEICDADKSVTVFPSTGAA